ncbi:MAG: polysaccharide deacetylase family protein [Steroidobacteraceae bacterium]
MKITLTFDNGPDPDTTPEVLKILEAHGILSTFFVLGSKAASADGAGLVARIAAAGHWVGNHTWSHHTPLGELDPASSLDELERTHEVLVALGIRERLFRPFGRAGQIGTHLLNPSVVAWLESKAYGCVLWNCVPGDWRDPEGWCQRGLEDVRSRSWSVVVLHDLPTGAMRHLDAFITQLKREGADFVQAFPPECMPIESGRIVLPLSAYVADDPGDVDRS